MNMWVHGLIADISAYTQSCCDPMPLMNGCTQLPGWGGETVRGEWASPRAARRHKWCGETKSVMSKEGGGPSGCRGMRENMAYQEPPEIMK